MDFQERMNFWMAHSLSPDEAEVQAIMELKFGIKPVPWQDIVDSYKAEREINA